MESPILYLGKNLRFRTVGWSMNNPEGMDQFKGPCFTVLKEGREGSMQGAKPYRHLPPLTFFPRIQYFSFPIAVALMAKIL